jgi:nucleoid-associated protein YgaU
MGLFDKKDEPAAPADFSDVTSGESTEAPPPPEVAAGKTYTVKSGDSLSRIAKSQYGDASKWKRIYEANKDKIKNPDLIYPGQEFTIPDAPSDTEKS